MGNIRKVLKEKDVGSIGIGAMIVFIAMVLVAGIAASVLIQTSTKLEMQAMKSGQETIGEVSTGIAVTEIEGFNESGSGAVNLLAIGVRPRAGSADIDLSETIIELSDSSTKNYLVYSSGTFTDTPAINGNIFTWSFYPNANTIFYVIVLEDADGSIASGSTPVINRGDHVILAVNTSQCFTNISTRTDVIGMVIPEEGSPGVISFTTPASYTERVVELQ
jgi:flagellin FlaB